MGEAYEQAFCAQHPELANQTIESNLVMHRVCMLKTTVGLEASHCSNIVHSTKKCKAAMKKVAGARVKEHLRIRLKVCVKRNKETC